MGKLYGTAEFYKEQDKSLEFAYFQSLQPSVEKNEVHGNLLCSDEADYED